MPITNQEKWDECVRINTDPYGGACVAVAREAMRMLDEGFELKGHDDTHKLICDADDASKAGGITGFMAGAAASMISSYHSRGEEFRKLWNTRHQINDEGDKANESGSVLNPALLSIETKGPTDAD